MIPSRLLQARVARLATADLQGRPHVVPCVFAWDGTDLLVPLDAKPKRVDPRRLRRVRNLEENPRAVLLVDHYEEDWSRLWFVMVEAEGRLDEVGEADLALLRARYPQYESLAVAAVLRLRPTRVMEWPSP